MLVDFDILPNESRLWIYASEYKLTDVQEDYIINNISNHLKNWQAHKSPLTAGLKIVENHFIIVGLDESKNAASGCSIDTLQRQIQQIENDLTISLLNRLNVFCVIDESVISIPSINLSNKDVNKDTLFYDLTIQKKSDLDFFLKPISEGWFVNSIL